MTSSSGDEIVNDFTRRGFGELASPRKPSDRASAVIKKPSKALVPMPPHKAPPHTASPQKPRKRTREQRLVLAFARLLAARMR